MPNKKKDINKINKTLEENRQQIDQNSKEIKGYGSIMSKIIDPETKKIQWDNVSISNAKAISTSLFNMRGKDKLTGEQISELILAYMNKASDIDNKDIETLIKERKHSYREYDYLATEMPEIRRAIKKMAGDIVYPNGQGMTGIKIEFRNNDAKEDGESYNSLMQYLRPLSDISTTLSSKRLYSFDIEEEVQRRIRQTIQYGACLAVTVPYSSIANDLLFEAEKEKQKTFGESYNSVFSKEKEYYFDNYENDILKRLEAAYESKIMNQTNNFKLKEEELYLKRLDKGIEGYGESFIDNNFYSQADVDYLHNILTKEKDKLISSNENYNPNKKRDLSTIYAYGEDEKSISLGSDVYASLQEIREKRKLKFNIDKIRGCTTELLDLKRTLPLFIKDELMGVLVIREESEFSNQRLSYNLRMLLTPDQLSNEFNSRYYKDELKRIVMFDIGNTLKRNIDKKLLRNNPTLLEDIEFLLDEIEFNDLMRSKIRFIPAEFLTLYKTGDGPFGTSVLEESKVYIHASIHLTKNELLHNFFLNKDRYLFKIPHSNDASGLANVMNYAELFRNTMPTLEHVSTAGKINNTLSARSVVLVPQLPDNGGDLFEIQQLDTKAMHEVNTDFIDGIKNAATLPFGYPADILNPNSNVDFAKKVAHINNNTLEMVLHFQKSFTLPVSEECTKRLRYMTGNDEIECIITFDPPRELQDAVTGEMLNTINNISDIYANYIDKDVSFEEKYKELAKHFVNEELLTGVIDLNLLEKVKKRCVTEGSPLTEEVDI